jgi:methionyl-tRNA formyltransferase
MDSGADSGDIVSQIRIPILEEDYAKDLYERVSQTAEEQIVDIAADLVNDRLVRRPQDPLEATYWRKRTPADGRIDFRMSSTAIRNLVRALSPPYPGASFACGTSEIIVGHADLVSDANPDEEPGKILSVSTQAIMVKTGDGAIRLTDMSSVPAIGVGEYL